MNVYQIITERIINRIQEAEKNNESFHWIRPWSGGNTLPVSYVSQKPYHGINRLLLDAGCEYITYHAIQKLNESLPEDEKIYVKKNSKALPVMYFNTYDVKNEDGTPVLDEYGKPASKWYAKYYNAFNREDCTNLHAHFPAEKIKHTASKQTKLLDRYIKAYCLAEGLTMDVVEDGTKCFYRPEDHFVRVPEQAVFQSKYAYYSAVLHELIHSTSKGLDRRLGKGFGTDDYCREELVAQIGAEMLLNQFKIVCDQNEENNDIAYISEWVNHLRNHEREIVIAAQQAERACEYFMETAEKQMASRKKKTA